MECSVQELKSKRDRGDAFVLLDVRTAEELTIASLPGALHIPLHALEASLNVLEPHRDDDIIVMCHHGSRSAMAQGFLLQHGFNNVLNLSGGIHAYSLQVDRSVPTY